MTDPSTRNNLRTNIKLIYVFNSFSYAKQLAIVDQLFPPVTKNVVDEDDDIEFTSFNYWRDPFTDVIEDSSSDVSSLQAIQSKPLAPIPEN